MRLGKLVWCRVAQVCAPSVVLAWLGAGCVSFPGPLSIDWSRPGSGGITRVAMTAPSHPNRQRTTLPPGRGWSVEGSRTAACGQGAMGAIPADCLARWGARRSRFRRDVLQGPLCCLPGCAGAKPPPSRWTFCRGRCEPGTAQLCVQQPFHRGWPRSSCIGLIGVRHGRIPCARGCRLTDRWRACRHTSFDEPWGPRPQAAPRCDASFAEGCCAGPAAVSHRLWRVRSRAGVSSLACHPGHRAPQHAADAPPKHSAGRRADLPLVPSRVNVSCHRAGGAWMTYWAMTRVPPGCRRALRQ